MILERQTPYGLLRFEDFAAGEWFTKAGEPAKVPRREYTLDGEKLDSVSSIVGTLSRDALVDWAGKTSALAARDAALRGELEGIPDDEIIDRLRALGVGHQAAKDEGAARGNATHRAFEVLAATGEPPKLADYPQEWRGYLMGAARAWLSLNCEPILGEEPVCNPEHGYAGRFDLLARTHRGVTLVDYKSARGGKVFGEAHWQTRLYEAAITASEVADVDAVVIVAIGPDGSVEIIDCAAEWEHVQALLTVFRARKAINAAMAEQRKVARKAAA